MIVPIVFIGIFIVADALSDAYIFRDFRKRRGSGFREEFKAYRYWTHGESASANRVWHAAQAVRQGAAITFAAYAAGYWVLAVIAAAAFWIVHDVLVNTIGLDRGPFYVGNTAWIDRQFQRFDNPERAMGIAKFVILTIAVGLTLIFKP